MIVLAAGEGSRLRPLTSALPKCLVPLGGRTLLEWQTRAARHCGISDIVIVGGHAADRLPREQGPILVNDRYRSTNMVVSLFVAADLFDDGFVMSYGDIAYSPGVLRALLDDDADVGVVVDWRWREYWAQRFSDPLSDAESLRLGSDGRIVSIGQRETDLDRIEAQYIGLVAFRRAGVVALRAAHAAAVDDDAHGRTPFGGTRTLSRLFMTDLLQALADRGQVLTPVPIEGGWVEIDSTDDLRLAEGLVAAGRLE